MALTSQELEKELQLQEGTLSDVDLSNVKVFTNEGYQQLISNQEKELEDKKAYSNQVGREEALKKIVRGVLPEDFEGRKDPDKIIEAIKSLKASDNKGATPELEELMKKNEALEKALSGKGKELEDWSNKYNDLETAIKTKEETSFVNESILAEFKKYEKTTTLSREDAFDLFKSRNQLKKEGDSVVILKDGEIVKDDLRNNKVLSDHFEEFMNKYTKKPEGGRGDESTNTSGKMSVEKFTKAYQNANPNASRSELNRAILEKQRSNEIEV